MSEPNIYKTTPMEHQATELEHSKDSKYWGLFWEMGLGKSKVTLDKIAYLYRAGKIKSAIIIAPKGVYRNWEDEEIPKHFPDDIPKYIARWSAYQTKGRKDILEAMWSDYNKNKLKILIINIEALRSPKGGHYAETFMKYEKPCFMVVDESTTIKSPGAKQTKTVTLLAKYASYRTILTGTPITQGPLDLFAQLRVLDPITLGFSSFFAFRNRYAIQQTKRLGTRTFNEIVGYKNLDELSRLLQRMGSRLKKEDCLNLPEKIMLKRRVELTGEQVQAYSSIKSDSMLLLNSASKQGILTAPLVITAMQKMHQVLCGHVTDDDGQVFEINNRRIEALLETIDEMEGPIVIWANYVYSIRKIAETLATKYGKDQVVTYYGGTTDDDRALARARFKAGTARFFVGNPTVGGYGLTLVVASNVIYFSNSYKLIDRLQSEDRVHRIGQTRPVTYVDLYVPGTIDEKILTALRSKKNIADSVVDNYQDLIANDRVTEAYPNAG